MTLKKIQLFFKISLTSLLNLDYFSFNASCKCISIIHWPIFQLRPSNAVHCQCPRLSIKIGHWAFGLMFMGVNNHIFHKTSLIKKSSWINLFTLSVKMVLLSWPSLILRRSSLFIADDSLAFFVPKSTSLSFRKVKACMPVKSTYTCLFWQFNQISDRVFFCEIGHNTRIPPTRKMP